MGCVVSRRQIANVNIASTPRDKLLDPEERSQSEKPSKDRAFPSSSTIKEEEEEMGSPADGPDDNFKNAKQKKFPNASRPSGRKEPGNLESHVQEQYIYYRLDSITANKRRHSETTNAFFQRSTSINRNPKDPSFSEFSFKQSMDSSCGEENTSPRSSRMTMGNAANYSGESAPKFDGLGASGGLRRTATPNFTKPKPSGFLMEKRYSMRNLKVGMDSYQQVSSTTSIIPHDLKEQIPRELGFSFNSLGRTKGTPSSIEDHDFPKGMRPEGKKLSMKAKESDKGNTSPEATLKSEEFKSPEVRGSPGKTYGKINLESLGKIPLMGLSELGKTAAFFTTSSESNDFEKEKKISALESEIAKNKLRLFEELPVKPLTQNWTENEHINQPKEVESVNTTNANNIAAISIDINNTKDASMFTKSVYPDENSIKVQSPFIRRVDPSKVPKPTTIFAGELMRGLSNGSIKDSPIKDMSQAQESPNMRDKNYFHKKLFPAQLSVEAKFTKNLLDLLKEGPEDFSPVLPLSHHKRQQAQKAKHELSGAKNTVPSSENLGSQTTLPTNLLTITRQETFPDFKEPKNSILHQGRLLRKGTYEMLSGNASPNILHMRLLEQDSHVRGGFSGHPQQTMRTEYSTILDNRTIYNPEGDISAINMSKYAMNYENEDIEFDETAANGGNRLIIPNGLTNESLQRESTPPFRLESSLNRRDSLSSTGKGDTHKGYHPNDGFESHLQQLEEQSPMGSKPGSKSSIGSSSHIPKPEIKQNPHKPLKDSAFRTTPRDSQLSQFMSQNSLKHPQQPETHGSRNLQKAKSCVIASADAKALNQVDEIGAEELMQSKTTTEVDSTNQGNQEISVNNRLTIMRPSIHQAMLGSKSQEPSKSQPPMNKNLNKGHNLKKTNTAVVETGKLDKTKDAEGQKRINNYVLIKDLGRGSFGKVKLSQDKFTNHYYAVKIADKEKLKRKMLGCSKDAIATLKSEIAIMKKLSHPNVVKLWEVIDDPKEHKLYLIMDYIKKGSVMSDNYWKHEDCEAMERITIPSSNTINLEPTKKYDEKEKNRVLSQEKCFKYFKDLILGLDYLHNHAHVIHRDIKPENLLIDQEDNLKISDFGVSHIMDNESNDHMKTNAGTKFFLPPEAFGGKGFRGKPADVWAAGATLFYFLTCKPPFEASNPQELKQRVINEEPAYPVNMNQKIKQVIEMCLRKDPAQRATLQDIMKTDWLTEDGLNVCENCYEAEEEFKISAQEISSAFSTVKLRATIWVTAKMKGKLNKTREKIEKRKTLISEDPNNPIHHIIPLNQDSSRTRQEGQ